MTLNYKTLIHQHVIITYNCIAETKNWVALTSIMVSSVVFL